MKSGWRKKIREVLKNKGSASLFFVRFGLFVAAVCLVVAIGIKIALTAGAVDQTDDTTGGLQVADGATYTDVAYSGGVQLAADTASITTTTANTKGLWHFDTGSGTSATDSSGNINAGTLSGAGLWTTEGKFSNALNFSGVTTDVVTVPASASLGSGAAWTSLTLEAFVKSSNWTNTGAVWTNANYGVAVSGTPGTKAIKFDLSWQNAWRDATNYDAAWVFIKYSTDAGVTWSHATLKTSGTNPTGFSRGTATVGGVSKNLDIVVPADKKGAFVQIASTDTGSGNLSATGIEFLWDYVTDGVSVSAANSATIRVFAIEMVYIPQGAFSLGSGGAETSVFYSSPTTTNPYTVSSENAITVGTGTGNLYYALSTYGGDQLGPVPAAFPKGYNAFYLMKYELSQGQWVGFFNTLTSTQKTARDITAVSGKNSDSAVYRNTVSWVSGDASAGTNQYVACNYLNWTDVAAYADWAALRPASELEFEKAARGPSAAVADEYAWGSTAITQVTGITNSGLSNEGASNSGSGLCVYGSNASVQGPLRSGFADTAGAARLAAGAGYYKNMELSGNLWERLVTVGNATGRGFTGLHGNGVLNASGDADVTNWPGTNAIAAGFRGNAWYGAAGSGRVSARGSAAYTTTVRDYGYGARLSRTSP